MPAERTLKPKTLLSMRTIYSLLISHSVLGSALACSPPPHDIFESSEKRVRERYTQAESIELATIVHVQPITSPDGHGGTVLRGERVTFRVDRIFKGRSKPGKKIIVESTGMCDYSVAGNAALKNVYSPDGNGVALPSRQWLFYRRPDAGVFIGETDMARPVDQAKFDLQLLERWRKQAINSESTPPTTR